MIHRAGDSRFLLSLLLLGIVLVVSVGGREARAQANDAPVQITIAGGPESSLYAVFATELKAYLESSFPQGYRFTTVPTVGSIENIERLLLDRNVMIAIAQEDVAHYF